MELVFESVGESVLEPFCLAFCWALVGTWRTRRELLGTDPDPRRSGSSDALYEERFC